MLPLLFASSLSLGGVDATAVSHDGVLLGDAIAWTSTYDLDAPVRELTLAVPLPANVELTGSHPLASPERDADGAIIGFALAAPASRVDIETRQRADFGDSALLVPLLDGDCVQRVTLAGGAFTPDDGLGIVKTIVDQRQLGISDREERQSDRALGRPRTRHPMYVVADPRVREAGGLIGTLAPADAISTSTWMTAGGIFLAVMAVLAGSWKVLARFAEAERVDAYIKKEFVSSSVRE